MPYDPRTDREETPEGRIAAAAFNILEATIVRHAKTNRGPKLPDRADFRDGLALYVQREILTAQLAVVKQHGTFPHAVELQKKIDEINWQIAKAENKE